MKLTRIQLVLACALAALALPATRAGATDAGTTHVAVAANFTQPAKEIAAAFKQKTGYEAALSFGASPGQFYAQISQGAPFEVFLSADEKRPKDAAAAGLAVPESRFTYAIGQLVLWSKSLDVTKGDEALKADGFAKLAIANPATAPYGAAALETLKALGLYDKAQLKIVQGNSIAQAFQFVETGNAELGFVARSQLANVPGGSRWLVPQSLYKPIRQDAILLQKGANSAPSKAFLDFLRGPEARTIIEKFGYALDR